MANIGKIARRTFLIGTAAIVGGVAFGVYKVRQDAPNPLIAGDGEATLNPYILLKADGITIIAPRAEMGQGVHTTLAALVAEEMDAAWEDITVLHGPPAQAYYNQALVGLALPFHHYADSDFQHSLRQNVGMVGKLLNLQVTGGSTSTKDAYNRMRHAGASAREALKLAAATQLGVDASTLRTQDSKVIAADGTEIPYTTLAEAVRDITPPDVELRTKSEWKYLGKSMPRTDMVGKSTGTAPYAADTKLDGMKFATVRMNPKRSGMISYDESIAKTMPGVESIINLGNGIGVVASNTWLAIQAANAVDITWEPASYPNTTEELIAATKAAFDLKPNSTTRDDGDVNDAIGGTEVTAEYTVPYLAHSTMEPMNATAIYRGNTLEVWSGNQAPVIVQEKCAEAIGLSPEQVTIHTTLLGGGFGRRVESDFSVHAAKIAKAFPDTPIRMTWSREEDMQHDFYRPAAMAQFRGVVVDGKAVLLDGKIAAQSVTHSTIVEGAAGQPYRIPNFRITGHLADLSVPLGFWRSVGNSHNGFFFDTFIDELAHAAAADPLQFRLDLAKDEHAPFAGVIVAVDEMLNWAND